MGRRHPVTPKDLNEWCQVILGSEQCHEVHSGFLHWLAESQATGSQSGVPSAGPPRGQPQSPPGTRWSWRRCCRCCSAAASRRSSWWNSCSGTPPSPCWGWTPPPPPRCGGPPWIPNETAGGGEGRWTWPPCVLTTATGVGQSAMPKRGVKKMAEQHPADCFSTVWLRLPNFPYDFRRFPEISCIVH